MVKTHIAVMLTLELIAPQFALVASPLLTTNPNSALTAQPKQGASMIFVSPLGNDNNNGSQGQPLRTITAAVQRAQAGTIIQLVQGTYSQETGETFPIRLPKGVILRGDTSNNGAGIVITGGGRFMSPTFADQNIAILVGDQARVEGVTVTNPNRRGYALWLESAQNAAVVNNTLINSVHDGVFMTGTTRADITGNIFQGNGANGISAVGSSSGVITGNTFDNTGFAIVISQRSSVEVSNNRIVNNRGGIIINNLATPTIRGNLIANNQEAGIVILPDRNGNPVVNMGTVAQPGRNIFENNRVDINNASRAVQVAVGNQLDSKKVVGTVDLIPADVAITPPTAPTPANQGLADVRGHWAERQIIALAQRNIIKGFEDGTFRPEQPVTRAQFAAILAAAFPQKPKVRPVQTFSDVPDTFWGHGVIGQAFATGFMSGFPSGEFRPADNIPRVQVLVALVSGNKLNGGDPARLKEVFNDASDIPNYALQAIATAQVNQLVVNHPDPKVFEPNRPATRAEVAAMMYQLLVRQGVIK
ncbi:MAG: DUF1565 domain-containing protein [Pseudanabaenaceae cyanobacterium]